MCVVNDVSSTWSGSQARARQCHVGEMKGVGGANKQPAASSEQQLTARGRDVAVNEYAVNHAVLERQ